MSDSNAIPNERIRIFDRSGLPVAEFQAAVRRSWVIGDEGRARFYYANRDSDIVSEDVLEFGNWLLIENDSLPPWVGIIDPPRKWGTREIEVSAYTPERLFAWRIGPIEEKVTSSPGAIFDILLGKINLAETTILRAGQLYQSAAIEETLNPTQLIDDLQRLYERSGEEYQFRPVVNNGRLAVYADWVEVLGEDTQAILQSGGGGNIEQNNRIFIEDDPITNLLLAYGDGETWTTKPTATIRDVTSQQKYGLRMQAEEYSGVSNVATLQANGEQLIEESKQPLRTGKVNAINVGDTFDHIKLGNRLTLRFEQIGFQGTTQYETRIRIIGMKYDPGSKNVIDLVIQELV